MAFEDQNEYPVGSSNRKHSKFLPRFFRTSTNEKFVNSTIDQLFSPGAVEKLSSFVGRRNAKANINNSTYLSDVSYIRETYQLEPALVVKDELDNVVLHKDYIDYLGQLDTFNSNTTNQSILNEQEMYSWNAHINFDMFSNFREYYWMPSGPQGVAVYGQTTDVVSTYKVSIQYNDDNETFVFSPDGVTQNPTIELYKGQTYKFEIDTPGHPFAFVLSRDFQPGQTFEDSVSNNSTLIEQGITIDNQGDDFGGYIEKGTVTFRVPENLQDSIYYISLNNINTSGLVNVFTIEDSTSINVTKEIIGKKTYTTSKGFDLSNGMKVYFTGNVTPSEYATGEYYIEGVGEAIALVPAQDLDTAGVVTDDVQLPFDNYGFDEQPYSLAIGYPSQKDYITINRASPDLNAWSRYNRWFHVDVITKSANINNSDVTLNADSRAKRPIIEFNAGIQLYKNGLKAKTPIDLIDTVTTDVFSTIEGTTGYNIDQVTLVDGMRILFTADNDPLVQDKIFVVNFIDHKNSNQIALTEADDATSTTNDIVFIKDGVANKGKQYYYTGSAWKMSQEKTSVNQLPLFDLFDENDTSYADYNDSTFVGNKIFSYKVGTGSNDNELGFPLTYKNINNVGDIVFCFNLLKDECTYIKDLNLETLFSKKAFVKKIDYNTNSVTFENAWKKHYTKSRQAVVLDYFGVNQTNNFVVNCFTNSASIADLKIKVYKNKIYQDINIDYTIDTFKENKRIVFTNAIDVNDFVTIKCYSKETKNSNGYYEVPYNLERNPDNNEPLEFTIAEVSEHVDTITQNIDEFVGMYPGVSNLRDLGNICIYGDRFVQHTGPINLPLFNLTSKDFNIVNAIKTSLAEYSRFKREFIRIATDDGYNNTPAKHVDYIVTNINLDKRRENAFYNTDMLPVGGKTILEYTVLDEGNPYYPLSSPFSLNELSNKAVIVYVNGNQVLHNIDYTFTDEGFVFFSNIAQNDTIEIHEYENTEGSYVPATPTKLGLYPLFKPELIADTTYNTTQNFVRGHDGSLTLAYNDYRDDLLLELEKRIYNNVKKSYDSAIFDISNYVPGLYRNTGISKQDFDNIMIADFVNWTNVAQVYNYYTNNSDRDDSFSWNYRVSSDATGSALPGFWRGIYKFAFDTDTPNLTPWEMLGYSIKPTWWEGVYGPAPYTSDNKPLWQDLQEGKVKEPGKSVVIKKQYKRPGLLNNIPVDENGQVVSPYIANFVKDFTFNTQIETTFRFGDHNVTETAWRRSSEYAFSLLIALCILKPAEVFGLGYDRSNISTNVAGNKVYNNFKSISTDEILFPDTNYTSGLVNYIYDYSKYKNIDFSLYKSNIQGITNNLSFRLAGFSDKSKLNLLLDSKTPNSSGTIFAPQENYNISLKTSSSFGVASYSGVIVEKVAGGYKIDGYDRYDPNFEYVKPKINASDPNINVGGVSEEFAIWNENKLYVSGIVVEYNSSYYRVTKSHTSTGEFEAKNFTPLKNLPIQGGRAARFSKNFETKVSKLQYGSVIKEYQDVVDFLLGYGKYLESQGFVFDNVNSGYEIVENWSTAAQEFLFWTTQNWGENSLITLSPGANKILFNKDNATPDNIYDSIFDYEILDQDGKLVTIDFSNIVRTDENSFSLTTTDSAKGIFFVRLFLVQKEHVVVIDNETIFADTIYNPISGYRQERIKTSGYRTADWNGTLAIPGFVYDQPNVKTWTSYTDYQIGDVVKYKDFYYASNAKFSSGQSFDSNNWTKLSEKPENTLIPNFEYKADQFADFYDLDTDNFDAEQQKFAQHTIAYQKRTYLQNIINDDTSQYKFYQGMLQDKGTTNVLTKLFDKLSSANQESIETYEEWALRLGQYGATDGFKEFEIPLDETKFQLSPQPIEFVNSVDPTRTDLIYEIPGAGLSIKPLDYNNTIFATHELEQYTKTGGYVAPKQIDYITTNIDQILGADANTFEVGDKLWVTSEKQSWNVYQIHQIDNSVMNVTATQGGFVAEFEKLPTDISVGDIIGILNVNNDVDGYRIVRQMSGKLVEFWSANVIESQDLSDSTLGSIVVLKSLRYNNPTELNDKSLANGIEPDTYAWIDDVNGNWKTLKNNPVYTNKDVRKNPREGILTEFAKTFDVNTANTTMVVGDSEGDGRFFVFDRISDKDPYLVKHNIQADTDIIGSSSSFGAAVALTSDTQYVFVGAPNASNIPNRYRGVFDISGTYSIGDIVSDRGILWRAVNPFVSSDGEYNNGAVGNVSGDGSDFFKREVTTNGVRIMGAGSVGGQVAVPDAWLEKVARMFELFLDPNGAGINESFQRAMIQTLSGDAGTYHAGFPTIQRVARGAGADYTPNFLTDEGIIAWNLTNLFDTHVQNDMVWYLNSTGDGYGVGDLDAQEVIEHVFHTLHMHGLPAEDIKLYPYLAADWDTSDLYNAMVEAYDAGKWDPSGYQPPGSPDEWKTDGDAFEVAAKEYLYLLNFCMFEYTELWDGGSLAPEWTDDMRTQAGIQANNPLGYAFHNTWIAPVISKPSLATIRSIFQDGNTPDQDDPTLAGASGYVSDGTPPNASFTQDWESVDAVNIDTDSPYSNPIIEHGAVLVYKKTLEGYELFDSILPPSAANNEHFGKTIKLRKNTDGKYVLFVGSDGGNGRIYFLDNNTLTGKYRYAVNRNFKGEFSLLSPYNLGEIVYYEMPGLNGGSLYSANSNLAAGVAFNFTNWTLLDNYIEHVGYLPNTSLILQDESDSLGVERGENIGDQYDVSKNGDVLIVNAQVGTREYIVSVYRKENGRYGYSQTLTSEISGEDYGKYCAISDDGTQIAISSTRNDATGQNNGKVYIYTQNNQGEFEKSQELTSVAGNENEKFGISLNFSGDILAIASEKGDRIIPEIYDSSDITFDAGTTTFVRKYEDESQVFIFQKIFDTWIYAEEMVLNIPTKPSLEPIVLAKENHVYISYPELEVEADYGAIVDLRRDRDVYSWAVDSEQIPSVDLSKVKRTFVYDKNTSDIIQYLDLIDPIQGKVAGIAEQNLDYKTGYDPAEYSISDQDIEYNQVWNSNYAGKYWWEVSSSKWYNPYQDSIEYQTSYWNKLLPGYSINVYEWIESDYLPDEYDNISQSDQAGELNITGLSKYGNYRYSIGRKYDPVAEKFTTKYYYWVSNKQTVTNNDKDLSVFEIANIIADPRAAGIRYAMPLSENRLSLVNCESIINDKDTILHIDLYKGQTNNDRNIHTEYKLISEGLDYSNIPSTLITKWIDSLVGYDIKSRPVPDKTLAHAQRYGIENKPRQGMFVNNQEALKQVIERANKVLSQNIITDFKNIQSLFEFDKAPSKFSGEWDTTVNSQNDLDTVGVAKFKQAKLTPIVQNGKIVDVQVNDVGYGYKIAPTVTITGNGTGAEITTSIDAFGKINGTVIKESGKNYTSASCVVRKFAVLVQVDSTIEDRWAVYQYNETERNWFRAYYQEWNVSNYWSYVDYYASGYDANTAIDFVAEGSYALESLNDQIGDVVKIKNIGTGGWLLLRKVDAQTEVDYTVNYETIGRENGTIEISNKLYVKPTTGFDNIGFDTIIYDREPYIETRKILQALKDNIFIDDLSLDFHNLFFISLRYALTEQQSLDWAFKTSFIKAKHNVGALEQKVTFKNDNLSSFEDFINEVKPYKVNIREFISSYENIENSQSNITDFDLPPRYDIELGKITTENLSLNNGLIVGDTTYVDTNPQKNWKDNYKYKIKELVIYDAGYGLNSQPVITISGANGPTIVGKGYRTNNTLGSIEIDTTGAFYTTVPTITIDASYDEDYREPRVIAILGDGVVRATHMTMKFDRTTGKYSYSTLNETETFTGTGSQDEFTLIYPLDTRTTKISITKDGYDVLSEDYVVENVVDTTKGYTRYKGKVTFETAPELNSNVVIKYYKSPILLSAEDRVQFFYQPTSGMPGKDLSQLMDGVDYDGVLIDNIDFSTSQGWDTGGFGDVAWDVFTEIEDEIFILDGSTNTFELAAPLEDGAAYNVYKGRASETNLTRIDDPNYDVGSGIQNKNALMNTIYGDGIQTTVVLNEELIQTNEGDKIIFRKSTSDGSFIPVEGVLDTELSGGAYSNGAYSNAAGTDSGEIIVDGDGFVTATTSKGPEELVPGQIVDALDIRVLHKPDDGQAIKQSYFYEGDNTTGRYAVDFAPQTQNSLIVILDGEKLPSEDYSFDYETNEVVIETGSSLPEKYTLSIVVIGNNGEKILDSDTFAGDGTTREFITGIKFKEDVTSFVTINGNVQLRGGDYILFETDDTYKETKCLAIRFGEAPSSGDIITYNFYDSETKTYSEMVVTKTVVPERNVPFFKFTDDNKPGTSTPLGHQVLIRVNNNYKNAGYNIRHTITDETRAYSIQTWQFDKPTQIASEEVFVYVNNKLIRDIFDYVWDPINGRIQLVNDAVGLSGEILEIYVLGKGEYFFIDTKFDLLSTSGTLDIDLVEDQFIELTLNDSTTIGVFLKSYEEITGGYRLTVYGWEEALAKTTDSNRELLEMTGLTSDQSALINNIEFVESDTLTLLEKPQTGDVVEIITFNEHDINNFDRISSEVLFYEFVPNNTNEYIKRNLLSKGYITLNSTATNANYVWVINNGKLLRPFVDYKLSDDKNIVELAVKPNENDYIEVLHFASKPTSNKFGFRIFKDILNRVHYKRLNVETEFKLSQPLNWYDQSVQLVDASDVPVPNRGSGKPGVMFIEGERLEYYGVDGNTLTFLRRGTLGTSIANQYEAGTTLQYQGKEETIPYQDKKLTTLFVGDGTSSVFDLDFDLSAEASQHSTNTSSTSTLQEIAENIIDVYKGGKKLRNIDINKFDLTIDQDSPEADVTLPKEFSVDLETNTITLVDLPLDGERVVVARRQGQIWTNNSESMVESETKIARFIRGATIKLTK